MTHRDDVLDQIAKQRRIDALEKKLRYYEQAEISELAIRHEEKRRFVEKVIQLAKDYGAPVDGAACGAEMVIRALVRDAPLEAMPVMLHCPICNARHIDEGEFATHLHHTHTCQSCGHTWRHTIGYTVGVQFLPGFKNPSKPEPEPAPPPPPQNVIVPLRIGGLVMCCDPDSGASGLVAKIVGIDDDGIDLQWLGTDVKFVPRLSHSARGTSWVAIEPNVWQLRGGA